MRTVRRRLALAAVVISTTVAGAAMSAPAVNAQAEARQDLFRSLSLSSQGEPILIKSDSLELDYRERLVTYQGNVEVEQGDVKLTSDRLSISYDETSEDGGGDDDGSGQAPRTRIREVVADGRVRIRQHDRVAEGRRAVFNHARQTIVLSDNAVLHEGPNQVAGERIVVYLKEERSVVEGGSSSRVRAVLYPGGEEDASGAAPEAAPKDAAAAAAADAADEARAARAPAAP